MLEAVELKDEKKLSLLKFQCAHRYGLQTMKDFLQLETLDEFEGLPNPEDQEFVEVQLNEVDQFGITQADPSLYASSGVDEESLGISPLEKITNISRTFNSAQSEGKNSSKVFKSSRISSNKLMQTSCETMEVPPPPRPSLSRLRRWLPDIQDKYPKAS